MSKVKIQGNASGTGTLTISAPNTNTDRTLTLPDGAGEILTDASTLSSSNLSGALPAIDGSALTGLSGGKTIQTVYMSDQNSSGIGSTNGGNWVGAGFNLQITPTDASNYILVKFISSMADSNSAVAGYKWEINNSTSGFNDYAVGYNEFSYNRYGAVSSEIIINPSDTSTINIDIQMYTSNGAQIYMVYPGASYMLMAQEITL